MPQRTNEFQTLFYHIKNSLKEDESRVEESAMIFNSDTGKKEEIDVLIEKKGDHPIRIGFQCRDHKRSAGPDWIRNLIQQRSACKLDLMIAVHSKGFTNGAIQTAERHNIRYMTLKRANGLSWDSKQFGPLKLKMVPTLFKASAVLSGTSNEIKLPETHEEIIIQNKFESPLSAASLCTHFLKESGEGHQMQNIINKGQGWVAKTFEYNVDNTFVHTAKSLEQVTKLVFDIRAANCDFPVRWSPYVLDGDGKVHDVMEFVYWNYGYEMRMMCPDGFPPRSFTLECRDVNYSDFSYDRVQW